MSDWTTKDGRSNSSDLYCEIVDHVERLIVDDAAMLLRGRSDKTAGLIVSQLAHVHGMAPTKLTKEESA